MIPAPYGLIAMFEGPEQLLEAAHKARELGYHQMDAYSPFPIEDLPAALGRKPTRVPMIVLAGGVLGALGGYFMQWYALARSYPLNVAGRPFHSWPAFIPISFELTILTAALFAVFSMIALNKLPQPYHPVFNVSEFARASVDRFFLCIEAADPKFDAGRTREFLESCRPRQVMEVPG